jgi:hypothetical protein
MTEALFQCGGQLEQYEPHTLAFEHIGQGTLHDLTPLSKQRMRAAQLAQRRDLLVQLLSHAIQVIILTVAPAGHSNRAASVLVSVSLSTAGPVLFPAFSEAPFSSPLWVHIVNNSSCPECDDCVPACFLEPPAKYTAQFPSGCPEHIHPFFASRCYTMRRIEFFR